MNCDAIYCFDRASVLFAIYPQGSAGPRVVAQISEEALRDIFGAHGGAESLVEACCDHFEKIRETALQHYRRDPGRPVALDLRAFELESLLEADVVS